MPRIPVHSVARTVACQLAIQTGDVDEETWQLVGATRERTTTTTALGELARHGLITLRRGKIVIRDPARLIAHADGAHRTPDGRPHSGADGDTGP